MDKTFQLRRIPVWPVAKVSFIVFLIIGILVAIVYTIFISAMSFLISSFGGGGFGGEFSQVQRLGFLIIPVSAVLYSIFGTLGAIIWVLLYNFVAGLAGGIEITLESKGDRGEQRVTGEEVIDENVRKDTHVPDRPIDGF